ncbi:hypothetical protein HZ326_17258 [Fusarium oxysporum f. sp. albedinis]|nr:hypothetical protein HZ326_17258 [Fusarium oxysporum f. sp. albedinis]
MFSDKETYADILSKLLYVFVLIGSNEIGIPNYPRALSRMLHDLTVQEISSTQLEHGSPTTTASLSSLLITYATLGRPAMFARETKCK